MRGFRIELDTVRARLAAHPAVHDSMVVTVGDSAETRRLLAAVVIDPLQDAVAQLRRFAADELPDYAVPTLWAVVEEFPVTSHGKVDTAALERLATAPLPVGD
ncbi:AMP-binding enzyme [Kitasatospora sp. NPDC001159]